MQQRMQEQHTRQGPPLPWHAIDTVLLDMDGTLLDLHYDNTLWTERLPAHYGLARGIPLEQARQQLYERMAEVHGTLAFYDIDYWESLTGVDMVALHQELTHLIAYRPFAMQFLDWLQRRSKRVYLVTNAHRKSLRVKDAHCGIGSALNEMISCHDYGAPKEARSFWEQLRREHPFEPEQTLFIDDNRAVLDSARDYGIAHLRTIEQPDSRRPPRQVPGYRACHDFRELMR
jgi:putative hydrolase of the HAD superfamily